MAIEFISYEGEYPNLCRGILTVKIDGKQYRFGYHWYDGNDEKNKNLLDPFWKSGGGCGFDDDWNEWVDGDCPWIMSDEIKEDKYPKEILDRLKDILEVMNQNVPGGCCGGCL